MKNAIVKREEYQRRRCCDVMQSILERESSVLFYKPHIRRYSIKEIHQDTTGIMSNAIDYCLWCGCRLPAELTTEWEKILQEEFGIENPWSVSSRNLIPQEFLTDEWWKKRNL